MIACAFGPGKLVTRCGKSGRTSERVFIRKAPSIGCRLRERAEEKEFLV
jgi:hypothetical protein